MEEVIKPNIEDVAETLHDLRLRSHASQIVNNRLTVEMEIMKKEREILKKENKAISCTLKEHVERLRTMEIVMNKAATELVPKFAEAAEQVYYTAFNSIIRWMAATMLCLIAAVVLLFIKLAAK